MLGRRSFFGWLSAAVGGLLGLGSKRAEATVQPAALPVTEHFDCRTDKILVAVGASIPGVPYEPDDKSLVYRWGSATGGLEGGAWLERIPDVSKVPADRYPRGVSFAVHPEILVGTIDEIVDDFRAKLTRAAEAMYCDPAMLVTGNPQRNREWQPLFSSLCEPGKVAVLQVCDHNTRNPQIEAYEQRRMHLIDSR